MNANEPCKEDILIDLYIENKMPSYDCFLQNNENSFDPNLIQSVCEAGEKAKKYVDNILEVVHDLRAICRKEQAKMIRTNYKTNSSIVFSILDNKELTNKDWATLIKQQLQ